jgi:hypothetical protein
MALRIVHRNAEIPVRILGDLWRFDATADKIFPQLFYISGLKCDMEQPVFGVAPQRLRDFNVLMIVNFEKCQFQGAVWIVQMERFGETEVMRVKLACSLKTIRLQSNVSNSRDRWALLANGAGCHDECYEKPTP